jgi:hypothetical protein
VDCAELVDLPQIEPTVIEVSADAVRTGTRPAAPCGSRARPDAGVATVAPSTG